MNTPYLMSILAYISASYLDDASMTSPYLWSIFRQTTEQIRWARYTKQSLLWDGTDQRYPRKIAIYAIYQWAGFSICIITRETELTRLIGGAFSLGLHRYPYVENQFHRKFLYYTRTTNWVKIRHEVLQRNNKALPARGFWAFEIVWEATSQTTIRSDWWNDC